HAAPGGRQRADRRRIPPSRLGWRLHVVCRRLRRGSAADPLRVEAAAGSRGYWPGNAAPGDRRDAAADGPSDRRANPPAPTADGTRGAIYEGARRRRIQSDDARDILYRGAWLEAG